MLHVPIDSPVPAPGHVQVLASAERHPDGAVPSLAAQNIEATDFLKKEIRRVGAPLGEIRVAFSLAANATLQDPRAYEALTPRMRRLIDLAIVAGDSLSAADFDANEAGAAPPLP